MQGTPLLAGILGGGKGLLGEGNGNSKVNPNGVAHPLNGALGPPLCTLGVGCECGGLLSGVKAVGSTVNALGLGVDCHGVVIGGTGHKHKPTKVTEAPEVTESPIKSGGCSDIEKPIRDVDDNGNGSEHGDTDDGNGKCGCFKIAKPIRDDKENGGTHGDGNNDGDDCGCDDSDCYGCDGNGTCDCDDSDCKDFDCSQCDLER